jgi:Flp pilus assembly protein TadG
MRAPSPFRQRRGGILMIVAAGMTTLVGFGALVCDVGLAFAQRTRMQTAADAAALAAAAYLGQSQSRAKLEAITMAKLNGYQIQGTDIAFEPGGKQVTVAWKQPTGFVLGPVLNRMGVAVAVSSTAKMEKTGLKLPLVPFLVPKNYCIPKKGEVLEIKVGGGSGTTGNFGAGALDGNGAKVYEETILFGAKTPIQIGSFVDFEPGNMVGPTDRGVAERIAGDDVAFEDALVTPTKRLIVVPLTEDYTLGGFNGRSRPIMVRGFARMYLVGSQKGVVTARWIDESALTDVPTGGDKPRPKLVR